MTTWQEHIEALEIERTQLPIPSSRPRRELTPTLPELAERRRALIEAYEIAVDNTRRTA